MGIGEIGELLRRSTVQIHGMSRRRPSAGSGVIRDRDGLIVTNAHVLGPEAHRVELWDGQSFPAEVKERDDHRDLATLKVGARGLAAARFRSSAVSPGELVIAVGNPLGFTGALSTGVVHAVGPVPGFGRRPWVQAAVRLAPGNSGGPLADASGEVVGINTMIVSGIVTSGLALAVPSAAIDEFLQRGPHPLIGIAIRPVRLNRRRGVGLLIMSVEPGGAAEQASLLIGDVLVGTAESPFASPADLSDAIADASAGRLKLRFLRGDQPREREVVLSLAARTAEAARGAA